MGYPNTLIDSVLKATPYDNPNFSPEGNLVHILVRIPSIPLCTDLQAVLTEGLSFWEKPPEKRPFNSFFLQFYHLWEGIVCVCVTLQCIQSVNRARASTRRAQSPSYS